jgi:predicted nuclease of restriction endonuclease-like (RecB) superfamily
LELRAIRSRRSSLASIQAGSFHHDASAPEAFPDAQIVQQVVAQLPWGHCVKLVEAVKAPAERLWYAHQAIEHGWSRNVLVHQIDSNLFRRQGKALTNFSRTLPVPQSDLAQELLKDPYSFDFLALGPDMSERELERGLLEHLRALILELGKGFAFVGSQYHLEVGGQDYYIDTLFYHLRLRCFVVVDLKIEEFKPEFCRQDGFPDGRPADAEGAGLRQGGRRQLVRHRGAGRHAAGGDRQDGEGAADGNRGAGHPDETGQCRAGPTWLDPAAFRATITAETKSFGDIIRRSNIKME